MNEYPVPYNIKGWLCLAPCPHEVIGKSGNVIMLGSLSCRDCKHSADGSRNGGEPVRCMHPEERPSADQVAFVFRSILANANTGTFRYLIYDRLGFTPKEYELLYRAGGMAINNALAGAYESEPAKERNDNE